MSFKFSAGDSIAGFLIVLAIETLALLCFLAPLISTCLFLMGLSLYITAMKMEIEMRLALIGENFTERHVRQIYIAEIRMHGQILWYVAGCDQGCDLVGTLMFSSIISISNSFSVWLEG